MLDGLLTVALAYTSSLWLALVIWGLGEGFGVLFNINTASLRQAVVPNHMLGRIISIAMVLAWSAQPLGALAGGFLIERTGDHHPCVDADEIYADHRYPTPAVDDDALVEHSVEYVDQAGASVYEFGVAPHVSTRVAR